MLVLFSILALTLGQLLVPGPGFPPESELPPQPVKTLRHGPYTITVQAPSVCDPTVKQMAGYFEIEGTDKRYFYWFFGGPGCSSQLALLAENGPCSVNEDGETTTPNKYSWNSNANAFWVDQPPGTGFSEGTYDHDEHGVAEDMYGFLQAFFSHFPEYNRDFFIFGQANKITLILRNSSEELAFSGESYAGHYVPAISSRIFKGNKKVAEGKDEEEQSWTREGGVEKKVKIDLIGIAIGNGLTNPEEQYKWYPDMMYSSGTAPSVISEQEYQRMKGEVGQCTELIHSCNSEKSGFSCQQAFQFCNMAFFMPYQQKGLNPYDMREKCQKPPLCYDFSQVDKFLNNPSIQSQLGVSSKWQSCNFSVNMEFQADFMKNFHHLIPEMLHGGIKVLVYVGDVDFICNWIGNKHWVLDLQWKGKEALNKAKDLPWAVSGKEKGKLRMAEGLGFLQVYQAGHMVPMNQPEAALQIVNTFTRNQMDSPLSVQPDSDEDEVEIKLLM